MSKRDAGTLDGKPITQEMLDNYLETFERDWMPSEIEVLPTERGKVLRALQELNVQLYEVEALERKAKVNKQPFGLFIHTILHNEVIGAND